MSEREIEHVNLDQLIITWAEWTGGHVPTERMLEILTCYIYAEIDREEREQGRPKIGGDSTGDGMANPMKAV